MKEISLQESQLQSYPSKIGSTQAVKDNGCSFYDSLKDAVGRVSELRQQADQSVQALATGEEKDIHNTMIALEKADVSFQLMLQVRNKIISAYETIMHMNI
ncbi:Flagellar hook-basal body complex protein FliE [uncultured Desulfobacterium sp.]|uniref:Flagellar hook-basal body complex protein FliE n=1 Tax=uncultured Desulfobacterium sp. TaxID=201089 RepID=A0A445MTD1_9BACT|nr:Flagellar hook-basal body complex protein FliE [uncultured Desulfobacterium sp.]